jgi:lycopene beta-cyclase
MSSRATASIVDVAIVGGGLAGGLIALALSERRPELRVRLFEKGKKLGGNHRWSWFESDLDDGAKVLLAPFRKAAWDGYMVGFPGYDRALETPYRSMASLDFDRALRRELPRGVVHTGAEVVSLASNHVLLADQSRVPARAVIDCRAAAPSQHLTGGWQVFMGRHLRTVMPHGIELPFVMDATVEQLGGFRFVYVLPLSANDIFVEDTYYQDGPKLDRDALSARLDAYCSVQGWDYGIVGHETGVLPVVTGGDFGAFRAEQSAGGVVLAGARGGFTHPLTSYTLPYAAKIAASIADNADLPGDQLAALIDREAREHWRGTKFYRLLGRMLFQAARPEERVRIFERFYKLPPPLIERFYAGRSTLRDKARILIGKPPVPVSRAIPALLSAGRPMQGKNR